MLPPGKGGRDITIRKRNDFIINNVGKDAAEFRSGSGDVGRRARFFLILYSGHRRRKDMAAYMWWEYNLVPICIDLALDTAWGDLMLMTKDKLDQSEEGGGGARRPPLRNIFLRTLDRTCRFFVSEAIPKHLAENKEANVRFGTARSFCSSSSSATFDAGLRWTFLQGAATTAVCETNQYPSGVPSKPGGAQHVVLNLAAHRKLCAGSAYRRPNESHSPSGIKNILID